MKTDVLGDRMKDYERRETDRKFMKFAPVVARMDGRGFSRWTTGLRRPYDPDLSETMIEVARRLVSETGARIGYTQSDEITLVLLVDEIGKDLLFDGRTQKLCSLLASMTTAFFIGECLKRGGDLAQRTALCPHFDARVFQVPTRFEAANAVLWRERDATRNAVSAAARSLYEHGEIQGRNTSQLRDMLAARGQDFDDYPAFFRRGTFLQPRTRLEPLPKDVLARMASDMQTAEETSVLRRSIERIDMPTFSMVTNREAVIFERAEPETDRIDE